VSHQQFSAQPVPPGWYHDPASGRQRYWNGVAWTEAFGVAAPAKNGLAVAALVLGITGFVTTGIPLFVGLFLGGPQDILAIVFGIVGITRAQRTGVGLGMAVTGLILGCVAFFSIFLGAGTIW